MVKNSPITLTTEGYLVDHTIWNQEVAKVLAEREQRTLTEAHFLVLLQLREFYQEFEHTPAMRALLKWLKQKIGDPFGQSIYISKLFPENTNSHESPARIAARLAGLPKPDHCL